jgi:hypothetical protein
MYVIISNSNDVSIRVILVGYAQGHVLKDCSSGVLQIHIYDWTQTGPDKPDRLDAIALPTAALLVMD